VADNDDTFVVHEPFDIDDGSLRSTSHELAFVLGVEWAVAFSFMLNSQGRRQTEMVVHAQNVERMSKLAERHGCVCSSVQIDEVWSKIMFRKARS
jgi:hypothetical protein